MEKTPSDKETETQHAIRQGAVFITIPFALGLPPVIGWLVGKWLDDTFATGHIFMYILIGLGFAAGFKEVYRIIKRYGDEI